MTGDNPADGCPSAGSAVSTTKRERWRPSAARHRTNRRHGHRAFGAVPGTPPTLHRYRGRSTGGRAGSPRPFRDCRSRTSRQKPRGPRHLRHAEADDLVRAHSAPSRRIEPSRGFTMPLNVLRIVVLPEPLPPSSATMRPSGTEKATSRKTSVAPYQTLSPVTSAAGSHEHPPGSGHKAPLLSPKPEYSRMMPDRHTPPSQQAAPKVPIAPQNPRADSVRPASADMPRDQTSRPVIPASGPLLRHSGKSAERRRLLSRSSHGRAQRIQPRDATDREPRALPPCRSCGRYRSALYNE
jgi:hypothetical protein